MDTRSGLNDDMIRALRLLMITIAGAVILAGMLMLWAGGILKIWKGPTDTFVEKKAAPPTPAFERWRPPDIASVPDKVRAEQILYGRELIAHTSRYLGPEGSVRKMSNGMNCQNCHLDAGTKTFGNNYAAVAATYPKFRARSGKVESVEKRVNDCFERSLNGSALDSSSREMRAIVSYIEWLGSEVRKGEVPEGSGLSKLEILDRAADPANGKRLFEAQCTVCHGKNGDGIKQPDGVEYQFPPLWGEHSYNKGAGLFRLSTFAQFIRANMPLGVTFDKPVLHEQEAWDIAAYVNSLPRPGKDISKDWPKTELKPFDHPFGPYADPFSEAQHKYGPFKDIKTFYAERKSKGQG